MVWPRFQEINQTYYVNVGPNIVTTDGTVATNYAATWDGTVGSGGWAQMDGGVQTGFAQGMRAYSATRIYIFGAFSSIGSSVNLSPGYNFNLAMWDGTKWNYVGTPGSTNNTIVDVAYDEANDILYAVGSFTSIYGVSANRVAEYSGGSWSALGTGANSSVYSCDLDGDANLYITGVFGSVNSVANTLRLARYNIGTLLWESIGSVSGTPRIVRYDSTNNTIYLGGAISSVDSVANTAMLARYDLTGEIWESVGVFNDAGDVVIYDIITTGTEVYIGGEFVSNGTDVAVYDLSEETWTDLGDGVTYTFDPDPTNFQPICIYVDSNNNILAVRNSTGEYILKNGTTVWERVSALSSDIFAPGITLSKTTASVSESGSTDAFTVVLDAAPDDTIVLSVTSADTGEVTVSPSTLTFTTSNWSTPQTVTVTGVADNLVDSNIVTVVTIAVNTGLSTGTDYDAVTAETVNVTTTNIDVTGEAAASVSELDISEDGTAQTFTVYLNVAPPSGSVVLSVASSNTSAITVSPSSLTFTAINYSTPQTVTVTPVVSTGAIEGPFTVTVSVNEDASVNSYVNTEDLGVTVNWTERVEANAVCFLDPTKVRITMLDGQRKLLTDLKPNDRVKTLSHPEGALVKKIIWRKYAKGAVALDANQLGYSHAPLRLTEDHVVLVRRPYDGATKFLRVGQVLGAKVFHVNKRLVAHVLLDRYDVVCVEGVWTESVDIYSRPPKPRMDALAAMMKPRTNYAAT